MKMSVTSVPYPCPCHRKTDACLFLCLCPTTDVCPYPDLCPCLIGAYLYPTIDVYPDVGLYPCPPVPCPYQIGAGLSLYLSDVDPCPYLIDGDLCLLKRSDATKMIGAYPITMQHMCTLIGYNYRTNCTQEYDKV